MTDLSALDDDPQFSPRGDIAPLASRIESFEKFERRVAPDFPPDGKAPTPALRLVSASSLSQRAPARVFLVPDLIPGRNVTLLSGDGGTGKSLLALMLGVSVASIGEWLGVPVTRGRAVFVSAEDELDEVHRRLAAICDAEGLDLTSLGALTIIPLAGESAVLAVPERAGALAPTPLWNALSGKIAALAPAVVILDTSADFFGGNEISRTEVRQFVAMLRGLALKADCAILLLSHPSVAGMSTGTGLSGSTAWNNSVRSRLYLTRLASTDGEPIDPDARLLQMMKSNYSRAGGEIRMRWLDGRFVNDAPDEPSGLDAATKEAKAEAVFLDLLQQFTTEGRNVSANKGPTYAPSVFATHRKAKGLKSRALLDAMNSLLAEGRVRVETFGPPSKLRSRLVFVTDDTKE